MIATVVLHAGIVLAMGNLMSNYLPLKMFCSDEQIVGDARLVLVWDGCLAVLQS